MEVLRADHDNLKTRVHLLSDKVDNMQLAHAELKGRVESAEGSIDRLTSSSATSDQVNSLSTVVTLKLDHLLEKHGDMKHQITKAQRWVFVLVVCGICALLYTAFSK